MRSLLANRSSLVLLFSFFWSLNAYALQDPTGGKPFFPWLWEDQFRPTIEQAADPGNLGLLGGGALATVIAHQFDDDVYEHNRRGQRMLMSKDWTGTLAVVGSGAAGIGIAVTQLLVDQENGLMHARAIALTSLSHVTLAFLISRERPGGREDYLPFDSAFPSGHASSAFATATALSYSYGWIAGVPAFTVATAISAARVTENAHWLSDVVSGATLGIFWGRASYLATQKQQTSWMPVPIPGGMMLSYTAQLP